MDLYGIIIKPFYSWKMFEYIFGKFYTPKLGELIQFDEDFFKWVGSTTN